MKKRRDEIGDDEIRIIGGDADVRASHDKRRYLYIVIGICVALCLVWVCYRMHHTPTDEPSFFEMEADGLSVAAHPLGTQVDSLSRGYTETFDRTVNNIPLRIHIPHNASMTLHVGPLNKRDADIIYAAQAADVRADNFKIIGDFVQQGRSLSRGVSKQGFCAVVDGQITIGVADDTPLLRQAIEQRGYFFRQYPLVAGGELVENEPKGISYRRALCYRANRENPAGEMLVVECLSLESLHDFAQALVDIDVTDAIYLVGGKSYGWTTDATGTRREFGTEVREPRAKHHASYIVWRRDVTQSR
jgi:hypothetical protein